MNGKRKYGKLLVLAIAIWTLAVSIACGAAADTMDKAILDATPTCTNEWSNAVVLDGFTAPFFTKDGDRIEKHSLAGLTPLYVQADTPTVCHIVREPIGSSYNLVDCYEADAWGVIAGEEGLFLSK